jgi:predicted porin
MVEKLQRRWIMHKKLIVMAVAGALAAPAAALAQTTIYGYFNAEWSPRAKQPADATNAPRHKAEGFNSGASRIGIRGEEKISGQLSAWYQCESEIALYPRIADDAELCGRNSAVGLKGAWGNFFIGTWDSPIKRASGVVRITNETGWLGSQHMTLRDTPGSENFSNRLANTFNYDTPDMGGFSLNLQITTAQATLNELETTVAKGRVIGVGAQYATGPLAIVAAYSVKDENQSSGGTLASEDKAWLVGASYVFGPVKVGATYTMRESDDGAGSQSERAGWNLAADWKITPSGTIRLGFAVADDLKSTGAVAVAGSGSSTGAKQWQVGYNHNLSRRTVIGVAYVKLDNDSNGTLNLTDQVNGPADVFPGASADAIVLNLTHSF